MEMLISMFHRKQFSVVVEGIEAKDQARRIIECGADFIQGFYYARPMPLDAALDFLQAK